jgi:P2-related tail formation protein
MTLLPHNESIEYKKLDEALGARIEHLFDVNLSTVATHCDARYLGVLAKSLDVDISGLSINEARAFLESAFFLKQYAGTPSVLKKALLAIYADVRVYDQVGNYFFDIEVEVKNDVQNEKLERIKTIVNRYKNVRSKLRHFVMKLPNIEASYKVSPFCVLSVDAQSESNFQKDIEASIVNMNMAALRVRFELCAHALSAQNSEINLQGGLTWRL